MVIGELIKGSLGGLLGTKIRLQCSEQGLGSGYRKFPYFSTFPCVVGKGNMCRRAVEAAQPRH